MSNIINYNNFKKNSFLFSLNPALKIILTILFFKIIFTLNIDCFFKANSKLNIFLSFLPFFFVTLSLFGLLWSINFSFLKLIENLLNFKFFILFSFFIYLSFEKPSEKYCSIYIFENTFIWFFILFLFFLFFVKKSIHKKIYLITNLVVFLLLPFIFFKINFQTKYIQVLFFKIKDLFYIFLILIRISFILILNILISETTSFMEINDGLEIILKPLKKIGIPTEVFCIMISLIFMSIPFLLIEIQKIIKAQISRGLNLYTQNIFKKIYFLISLLVPIFVLIFQKSFVLANAMETRGFVIGNNRTKLSNYKIIKKDFISLCIVMFFFVYSFFY
ncbi:MAG: ABC-type cobalt transport system permease protein [Candidatus Phytoplasma cynodontis]|uniref:energy-coupling factor transporter transmembrane component T family protein n=1 Tax='Cynodon dactylon' phytoplasma TaxID=295320 RepID=UPI001265C1D1|nr:energy-coupling factor transporter transmembrane component T ['Cynodon dactylon' phytoplasma]KAB8122119.1 energy-coupling factor transporter transmembrane protein EcfT ['Cynodon dactylon' phytoplasma]WIA07629.1 MAG: ABC-type cobalt transport system permease protein [Candidatus Phytoplasma cynodontis]